MPDAKTVLGHRLAAGRGIEDGEDVLDILARSPATARFIARKLAVRFVSDDPPPALVERAARDIPLDRRRHPRDGAHDRHEPRVLQPRRVSREGEEPVRARGVGAALGRRGTDTTPRAAQTVAFLGAPIFGHQAPNGWPETGEAWMNAGAILNRINFGLALAGGRLPGASLAHWPETERLRGASREQQVDAVIGALLGGHVVARHAEILLNGENPLADEARRQRGQRRGERRSRWPTATTRAPMRPLRTRGGNRVRAFARPGAARGARAGRRAGDRRARVPAPLTTRSDHQSRGIMDRRVFMKSGAMALVTMGLSPSFLRRTAYGAELLRGAATSGSARGKTLICLFQRGAADALNVVVPHGEAAYYRLRPNIAIARPTMAAGQPERSTSMDSSDCIRRSRR